MKSKNVIPLILFLSLLQLSFRSYKDGGWKLVKNKDGIKAYTREVKNSDVKKVKVVTNVNASLSALSCLLKDIKHHESWMYNCIDSKILKTINETEYLFYTLSSAPWPINKRDIITHTIIKQDKNTKKVSIIATGKPNYLKEKDGVIRIKSLNSRWEFFPKENNTVDVTFYLQIDLGGTVPAWAINLAVAEGPFQTVHNLIKEVKKDKYKNAKLNFIEEL